MALYASDSTINKGEPYRNYIEEDSEAGKTSSVAPSNDYIPTAPDRTYSESSGVPHFVDQSGGIYPVMHNSVLFDHTPQQQAALQKSQLPVPQMIEQYLREATPQGGFSNNPDYSAAVVKTLHRVASEAGYDLNSQRGQEWYQDNLKSAQTTEAGRFLNNVPAKDRFLKTGQDSFLDTSTMQVIQGPLDKQDADMQLNAHLHEVANKNAQAQGEGAPSPTAYIPASADLQTPQMTLQDQGAPNPAGYIPPQLGQPASPPPAPQSSGGIMDAVNQMNSIERERFLKRRGIADPNPKLSAKDFIDGANVGVNRQDHLFPGTDVVDGNSFLNAVGTAKRGKDQEHDLTPEAIKAAADRYASTGEMPSLGMGKDAAEMRAKIINHWAETMNQKAETPQDQLAQQAAFKASKGELMKLQAQRGIIAPAAETAEKNLDMAEQLSKKVNNSGVPVLNRWINAGRQDLAGDADVSAFNAAVRVAVNEAGKVTSGATGGVTTDTARKEIEGILNSSQTPEQFSAVRKTLHADMQNRLSSYEDNVKRITDSIAGKNKVGDKTMDAAVASAFLEKAGGDKEKARKLAKDAGYQF